MTINMKLFTLGFFLATYGENILATDESLVVKTAGTKHDYVEPNDFIPPSFSATHVSLHEPSGQELMSSAIELSPNGLRVRELGAGAYNEMLQDFSGERGWLIDHERSISHLLQMVEEPEIGKMGPGAAASFLGPNPCGFLTAVRQGPGIWRGRRVTAFHCVNNSGDVMAVEFLDDYYQIIVYRRTNDGFVDELRGFTDRRFNQGHFIPPATYRDVDKQEFFYGAAELESYSETAER